jgi:outer membrane receptor protein involved in Fe transport
VTESHTTGVEASAACALTRTLTGYVNASYTDGAYDTFPGDRRVEGNRPAYLAPLKAGAGLEHRLSGRVKQHLRCRYVARRYGDAQNLPQNRMDDYWTLDWRIRLALTQHADMLVNVDNVFDTSYEEFPDIEQAGRFIRAGVEVTF